MANKSNNKNAVSILNLDVTAMEAQKTEYDFGESIIKSGESEVIQYSLKLKNGTYHNFKTEMGAELAHRFIGLDLADNQVQRLKARTLFKMSEISTQEGFADVGEMAQRLFGFSASTARNYARIGKFFVNDEGGMVSDFGDMLLSMSQLNILLSSLKKADFEIKEGEENVETLDNVIRFFTPSAPGGDDVLLSPGMKRDEMARRIKEYREGRRSLHGLSLESDEMKKKREEKEKAEKITSAPTATAGNATGTETTDLPFDQESFASIRNIVRIHSELAEELKNPTVSQGDLDSLEEVAKNSLIQKLAQLKEIIADTNGLVAEIKGIIG